MSDTQTARFPRIFRRGWIAILITTMLGLSTGAASVVLKKPTYDAQSQVFVSIQQAANVQDLSTGSSFLQQIVKSYVTVATSPLVLDPVINQLGLNETAGQLAQSVTVEAPVDTVILQISVSDTSAARAAEVANAVADSLSREVDQLSPATNGQSASVVVKVIQRAVAPTTPTAPVPALNIALGALVGLLLGVIAIVAMNRLDDKIRNEDDVVDTTAIPVLAGIPFDKIARTSSSSVLASRVGVLAERYRMLRANLQFVDAAQVARVITVTSSVPGEGKTTTAVNLALALAEAGERVILVDADLRKPRVGRYLGLDDSVGLTSVLLGATSVEVATQPWGVNDLSVLPAGSTPPNPSELLQARAMTDLVEKLRNRFSYVIFDSPPTLAVSDAVVLSRVTDGVLLVCGAGTVTATEFDRAVRALEQLHIRTLGIVLSMVRTIRADNYSYETYADPRLDED